MVAFIGINRCIIGVFSSGSLNFPAFCGKDIRSLPLLLLAFFLVGLLLPEKTQAQAWFPPEGVICKIANNSIDFGRIADPFAEQVGNFNGSCRSTAFVTDNNGPGWAAEAAYCLTVQSDEGVNATHYMYNELRTRKIAFKFYNLITGLPIGDGNWGQPLFDRGQQPVRSIGGPVEVPLNWGFRVQLEPGQLPPEAGNYSANLNIVLASGASRHQIYPPMDSAGACSSFPRQESFPVTVKATVKESCNLNVVRNIDFGTYTMLARHISGEGQIAVRCSDRTEFQVGISSGYNSTSPQQRFMKILGGTAMINYNLYQDSAGSMLWTDEWNTPNVLRDNGDGSSRLYQVYAIVPPQPVRVYGVYTDTVRVEVRLN